MNPIISILLLSLILYSSQNLGDQLAKCAIDQIGKPFKAGGIGPDKFDDFGLVYYCMKKLIFIVIMIEKCKQIKEQKF